MWRDDFCSRCAASNPGRCAGCGEFVFVPDRRGGRVGPDRRLWCGVCGTNLVEVDVGFKSAFDRVHTVLRTMGMRIGIDGLNVDLVPITRPDENISPDVLGVAHNVFDGISWSHHVKVQRFLPEHRFGATLVHEIGHVWLARLGGPDTFSADQQEGICELFAHLWMRHYGCGEALARWESTTIRRNDGYGKGYRWAVARYGLGHAGAIQDLVRRDCSEEMT